MRILKKLLRAIAALVLVPVLLFEEWGWEPLARALGKLSRLPVWAHLENRLRALPPWGAVLAFLAPMVMLFPVKLLGLLLLGRGHATSAVVVLLSAKLVGTAILAWLFHLVEPALMRIPVFARWYPRWKTWKDRLLTAVRLSAPWRAARYVKNSTRRWWRSMRRTS
ncbi:hypothetical protein QTH97_29430 [Variovorax sp. J22R24]|uniref:hypothetical protein n=1 Tax=Variovorax gracilis TaxID=3053502 RepID=UPI00257875F3|nr:hypothetical protein [Variovorax sp. J22R24]MDM0109094.1 hypothetical protein [Variovorax sp. J22R24]